MQVQLPLVHSPLVGCGTWRPVASDLAGDGFAITIPDLAGTIVAGPPYHLRQAQVIADCADGQPVILGAQPGGAAAGHGRHDAGREGLRLRLCRLPVASAGALLDGYRDPRSGGRLREMVDSHGRLPSWPRWWDEEELAACLPDPPVRQHFAAGCPRLPLAMLEEVHPPAPRWPDARGAYLQLSEAYEAEAARARELGFWRLLVPLTEDRVLAKARLRWSGWSLSCGCPRTSCDSHLACAAPATVGRERLKKGMLCW
jgi:hypothetical protein